MSSARGLKAQQRKSLERKAKFQASQAAKLPEERLFNRQDFDDFVLKHVGLSWERCLTQMRQWFTEFLTDDDNPFHKTAEEAATYFTPGGPPFTVKLVRMFLEYLIESRSGQAIPGSNGRLHHTTIHSYVE
ncbi:hypothetical protein H2199_005381 [Coniosporium tulheliwenetii]|uniref:Uncharacterized protein n=1 Tax=Coniosporium tulheliwenetii TaxID=3383036 RepID=A0ACC2Z1E4_9PEZI|nr:hypothetical protein H2199_005381 [Cladosporium sp. JES 115]